MSWNTINVDVDVDDILPQLDKNDVAKYFHLGNYDDSTPLGLIKHLKYVLGYKRPMLPEDVKEMINQWIDDNLVNCI